MEYDVILVEVLCGERDKGFWTSNGNWHPWAEAEKKLARTDLSDLSGPTDGLQ